MIGEAKDSTDRMDPTRRFAISGLAAGATLQGALWGCAPRRPAPPLGPASLDTQRLGAGFIDLAARARPAAFGFGVDLISPDLAWVSEPTARFPLQSVFKVFLAAAALSEVDAGRLRLSEPITLTEDDLSVGDVGINAAWARPPSAGRMVLPAVDLIALAVQRGDNTAADTIMQRIGGPAAVTAWLRAKGVTDINVNRYERDLQPEIAAMPAFQPGWIDRRAWEAARAAVPPETREAAAARYLADPRDTATLPSTLAFLSRLALGQLLSARSTGLLLRLMTDSATDQGRLRAGLPPGASLAHKTGTALTDLGLTPATNDIGIVTLASGRRFAMAAYLAGSTATRAVRDRLIADAAALATSCVH
jgi:beta-lactamase class A